MGHVSYLATSHVRLEQFQYLVNFCLFQALDGNKRILKWIHLFLATVNAVKILFDVCGLRNSIANLRSEIEPVNV